MVHLYSIHHEEGLFTEGQDIDSIIGGQRHSQLLKLPRQEDYLQSLCGELAARYLLCRLLKVENSAISMDIASHGKPYVKDCPYQFNISHSGNKTVCAVDTSPVGVDIERIIPMDLQLFNTVLTTSEVADSLDFPVQARLSYFYGLWTLKEAYLKFLGTGLSIPLTTMEFSLKDSVWKLNAHATPCNENVYFKQYLLSDGYVISACAAQSRFAQEIQPLSLNAILSFF